ncbi:MAG: hypothetical protein IIC70_09100 [Acidobacteria bacterium]|nr:hypothetical protein [Acidobacteriota bacterium]MCH8130037.1 hypothetical protein [Acidobacteriota bacterium]MCH8990634.1 hypothetical protein [Acidobacteriota bacterium]
MTRRSLAPYVTGSLGGVSIAMAFFAFFASFTALDTVSRTGSGGVAAFTADRASLGFLVFSLGALGGITIAAFAYVVGRAREPGVARYAFGWLGMVGIVLGGSMAFATVSLGITLGGSTSSGSITVPITTMAVSVAAAGLLAGAITAPIVDALASPAYFGDIQAATPVTSTGFFTDMGRAIGTPALSIAIGALLAVGLAELLLSTESAALSVAIFSVVGVVILGGTALVAARPWDRSS